MNEQTNPYESPVEVEDEADPEEIVAFALPMAEMAREANRAMWIIYFHMVVCGLIGGVAGIVAVFVSEYDWTWRCLFAIVAVLLTWVEFQLSFVRWEIRRNKLHPQPCNVPPLLNAYANLLRALVLLLVPGTVTAVIYLVVILK